MSKDIYIVIEHLRGQVMEMSFILAASGRDLARSSGGDVVGILLGYQAQDLANHLAVDHVLYIDHPSLEEYNPDTYQMVLADLIEVDKPRAVLFGSTSIGADVAGILSTKLDLPLVNLCNKFSPDGKYLSQICGGKIMVEGDLPEPMTLITIIPGEYDPEDGKSAISPTINARIVEKFSESRLTVRGYIEPEAADIDISKEAVLISIGRGIQNQDNIELAEELAELLGGAVSASRPVVDQGWLPTSRMVGKSGKKVKPKLYLALGISGAPEHVEGMTDSELIVAINTDPEAPIFNIAHYGAEVDLLDLTDYLIEQIEEL